ncbi:MAG: TPM domain-containing protein [Clostridia bacterium]|nr:TPM domain-containing protein [Clostridia bacterium]
MKKRWTAFVVCVILVCLAVWLGKALAPPKKNASDPYVYDGANALSADAEQEIRDLNVGSERKVYVLCVKSTGRYSLKSFAKRVTRDWKLSDNDALIVFRTGKGDHTAYWGDSVSAVDAERAENEVRKALPEGIDKAAVTFVREMRVAAQEKVEKSFLQKLLEKITSSVVWFAIAVIGVIVILKILLGKN